MPTPVEIDLLRYWLHDFDPATKEYLLLGFLKGFDVGFRGTLQTHVCKNLKSAQANAQITEEKIQKELTAGRFAGPFLTKPFPNLHISPLGLVETPGSFRLIHHLSFPPGDSVNDGIPTQQSTVHYEGIDNAIKCIKQLGRGCFMAKTDISNAFRILPICPMQYHCFGFLWRNRNYFDKCLLMDCNSSCQIFETFSNCLQWIAHTKLSITHMTHILDDLLILDTTRLQCQHMLDHFLIVCADIGVPMAENKTFAPSTTMTYLGYELDSVGMEVRLPTDKLENCAKLIHVYLARDKITLKELQSIIGTLNFACAVVLAGRAFLRQLIDLTIGISKPHHHIRLTKEAKEDLRAWQTFLSGFNGRSLFLPDIWMTSDSLDLYTDASASVGYGAVLGTHYFYGIWDQTWAYQNITLLEFYPIVLAVQIWGEHLSNKCIYFHTDNQALVEILNKQSSKNTKIMHFIRKFVLSCLKLNILFKAKHIPGTRNILADALSRQQVSSFHAMAPYADSHPHRIPRLPTLPS